MVVAMVSWERKRPLLDDSGRTRQSWVVGGSNISSSPRRHIFLSSATLAHMPHRRTTMERREKYDLQLSTSEKVHRLE